jgi:hypothetical protein
MEIMGNEAELEDQATISKLIRRLVESTGKQGVYYVLPFPTRWRLYAFPWEDFGDIWHNHAWQNYVTSDLAESWAEITKMTVADLKRELSPLWKSVPRGRVERAAVQEYTIFHGDDLADTGIAQERIRGAFELSTSKVIWSFDPHEQRVPEQQAKLRALLHRR